MATSAPAQRLPSPNSKYPFVGPNYQSHGEVQGYLYHPWTDKYYPDPKAQGQVAEAQGVGPKKDPSLGSVLLPAAAATAVGAGALEVGKAVPSYIGGLLGGGSAAAPAASTGSGLLGIGGGVGGGGATTTSAIPGISETAGSTVGATGGEGILGTLGTYAIPAAGALGAYDLIKNQRTGARGGLQGAASGAALGSPFGPWGIGIGAVAGGAAGLLNKKQESTKDYQKRVYDDLIESGIKGAQANYQTKLTQDAAPGAGTWDTGKYAGQKWSFEKANDLAKTDPTTFANSYGVLKTFGNDWSDKYTQEQKNQMLLRFANEGLFKSKKGVIDITDPEKAKQIAATIISEPSIVTRTTTSSPGIGKDGKRIDYSKGKGLLSVGSKK